MRILNLLIPAALLATAGPALADPASHKAAADTLLQQIDLRTSTSTSFAAMVAPMATSVTSGAKLSAPLMAKIETGIKAWINEDVLTPDFFNQLSSLYSASFTEAELKELTAFYQTPLGQKALKTLPMLTAQGSEIAQKAANAKQPDLIKRLQPLVPEIEAERVKLKAK